MSIEHSQREQASQRPFSGGLQSAVHARDASKAFYFAMEKYQDLKKEFKEFGKTALKELEQDEIKFGIVLFGRAYNAFAKESNLNIPHKFASKNIIIIPFTWLPNVYFLFLFTYPIRLSLNSFPYVC